ncbi:MAG: NYN domain-containing protein, partial [Clostridia bacterium]|nr:NYN domain-containing protein [Clostridia bacterium]
MNQDKKIALLIDAENISRNYRKTIMNELAKYGTTTYRRIYGDFTSKTISWTSEDMLKYSLTPIQQYSNTSHNNKYAGKNSSDITLVIDAMDILYSGNVEGFCIVSSDSDFTKLASRLREAGMLVIGMGEEKTPLAFRKSCQKFILLDVLRK